MVVVLHRAGEEHAHEIHHLLVVAVRGGARHGRVVFVDDYERLLLVVEMEGLCEKAESLRKIVHAALLRLDPFEQSNFVRLGKRRHSRLVPRELASDVISEVVLRRLPRKRLVVLERQVDDGISPLVRHPLVGALALRDRP